VVGFQQAGVRIEKEKEFEELKGAIQHAFGPEKVEKFLKRMQSKDIRVRDFEAVLAKRIFEQVDETLAGPGALEMYQALALSDQGQIREFYLSKVEEVESGLRAKFPKLYRYY
jgi:hypothetical protein